MFGDSYSAGHLRGLSASFDEATISLLDAIGVSPGWRCLEVGAGSGSIAIAIQSRAGSVIALDKDAQHLRAYETKTFTVVESTIEQALAHPSEHGLSAHRFDFIHARFVLDHTHRPNEVVEGLFRLLQPGGAIVLEEFDSVTFVEPVDPSDARNRIHSSVVRAVESAYPHRNLGRSLPGYLRMAGAAYVETQCSCRLRMCGTGQEATWRKVVNDATKHLDELGLSAAALRKYDDILSARDDADSPFEYYSPLTVRAWAFSPK